MKTTLGVGISVLSALAAQGKDFDRAELNAMLDRLAASPEPRVKCAAAVTRRRIARAAVARRRGSSADRSSHPIR